MYATFFIQAYRLGVQARLDATIQPSQLAVSLCLSLLSHGLGGSHMHPPSKPPNQYFSEPL